MFCTPRKKVGEVMNRVVVTGLGVLTPVGIGVEDYWKALVRGENGIDKIQSFDASEYPSQIAGEVTEFNAQDFFSKKESRRMDRFVQFASAAAQLAVSDAGLEVNENNRETVGVSIGTGIGGLMTLEESHKNLLDGGPRKVSPFFIPKLIANMASGKVSIDLGARGPNLTMVTACATGTHAIGESLKILQRGDAQVMITGGAEATVSPLAVAGFSSMKALSTRNEEPEKASRPFDKDRDGFVIAEGAGVMILETLEHAEKRNAPIYAELTGFGMSGDAYHMTAPCPESEGASACMEYAIADAGIEKEAVGYINAHGTSTEYNDKLETLAIRKVFGAHADNLMVSSTKSMTGHLLGAAGGIESGAAVLALKHQYVHPTINLHTPDPECDLDYVPLEGREAKLNAVLVNNFGFGGTNATLIFEKLQE